METYNRFTSSYVLCNVSPMKGYCPTTIQYSVTPNAQTSAALPPYVGPDAQGKTEKNLYCTLTEQKTFRTIYNPMAIFQRFF